MATTSRRRIPDGAVLILLATVIAGGCGYVANVLVGATRSSPADYVVFGVFWSALYLVVSTLSGIQQEVTRATHARPVGEIATTANPVRNFALAAAVVAFAAVVGSSLLWGGAVFPDTGWTFVLPIAVGGASYVIVAAVAGTLYGLSVWWGIALLIVVDGVLRLIGIVVAVVFGWGDAAVAWAVVLPFPLTPVILWWVLRRTVVGRAVLDVGYPALIRNVASTILASAAIGLMISGFPLILRVTSPGASETEMGTLVYAINLVRAPLVVVVLSLQSYMVVRFRNAPHHAVAVFFRLAGVIAAVAVIAAVVAWFVVPPLLRLFDYDLDGWVVTGLVLSSGLLGILCVSGPLALSRSQHGVYTAGWVAAVLVTIGVLLLPGDLSTRMVVALAVGPGVGVVTHVIGIATRRQQAVTA